MLGRFSTCLLPALLRNVSSAGIRYVSFNVEYRMASTVASATAKSQSTTQTTALVRVKVCAMACPMPAPASIYLSSAVGRNGVAVAASGIFSQQRFLGFSQPLVGARVTLNAV